MFKLRRTRPGCTPSGPIPPTYIRAMQLKAMKRETFQISIADRTVEIVLDDGRLLVDGRPVEASAELTADGHYSVLVGGRSLSISSERGSPVRLRTTAAVWPVEVVGNRERLLRSAESSDDRARHHFAVRSPMPGLIVKVNVQTGDTVRTGASLLVLEAMKMENEIRATHDGTIDRVHVTPGDAVLKNALLLEFESR